MHKAKLFEKLSGKKIRCTACQRYCQIDSGKVGFCLARKNFGSKLYSLNYGLSSGIQIDPIEKKPLYHFHPGTEVLSVGSFGCNFRCRQCLNWHCSWGRKPTEKLRTESQKTINDNDKEKDFISPEELVDLAIEKKCVGIAFTYNEPVIWPEYVYDTAKLAKSKSLYTVFVSNGSWSTQALDYYGPYLDAANIDFKGWGEKVYASQGAFWGELLDNLILAFNKYHLHLELTTLLIPGINDKEEDLKKIANFIFKNLGPKTPWHLSRFSPERVASRKFSKIPPTSLELMKKAYKIGKASGLSFVYLWAPPTSWEGEVFSIGELICPSCQKVLIKRDYWQPEIVGVKKKKNRGVCQFCGEDLNLII